MHASACLAPCVLGSEEPSCLTAPLPIQIYELTCSYSFQDKVKAHKCDLLPIFSMTSICHVVFILTLMNAKIEVSLVTCMILR